MGGAAGGFLDLQDVLKRSEKMKNLFEFEQIGGPQIRHFAYVACLDLRCRTHDAYMHARAVQVFSLIRKSGKICSNRCGCVPMPGIFRTGLLHCSPNLPRWSNGPKRPSVT